MQIVFMILLGAWAIMGIVLFGFITHNILQKGHNPLAILPLFLLLGIAFGSSLIGGFYSISRIPKDFVLTPYFSPAQSNSSAGSNLYR